MARGKWYTDEENAILIRFAKDHDFVSTNIEKARLLHSYGMFVERSEDALASQIGRLLRGEEDDQCDDPSDDQAEQLAIVEAENRRWEVKYNALVDNLFKGLVRWPEGPGVKVDIPVIKDAIREAEPARYRGLCEDFENQWEQEKAEKEDKDKKTPGRTKK